MSDPRPAAAGVDPGHFPGPPVQRGHVEPCPRRVRARRDGQWIVDPTTAFYVWEHPYYPQYAVPKAGLDEGARALARPLPDPERLPDHVVVCFEAAEDWYEENEPVHGHPRSPYVRVDALRSDRSVTVTLPGEGDAAPRVVARSAAPVAVFETGLPPRWYLDPTCVDFSLLTASETQTLCPYKGRTTGYWSVEPLGDVAWSYGAPRRGLESLAGLVAFDDSVVTVKVEPPA